MDSPTTSEEFIHPKSAFNAIPVSVNTAKYESTKPINAELLQIINVGINNIVINIKAKLGTTTNENKQNTIEILDIFNTISTKLTETQNTINKYTNEADTQQNYAIKANQNDVVNDLQKIVLDANGEKDDTEQRNILIQKYIIKNLDDETNLNKGNIERNIKSSPAIAIQTRLDNCQNLEMLYLIKHNELMTTFQFTINLFNKYKYVIDLLMHILQNLVTKTGESITCDKIKLPINIIEDLPTLLKDQENVLGVINSMKLHMKNGKLVNLVGKLGSDGNPVSAPAAMPAFVDVPLVSRSVSTPAVVPPEAAKLMSVPLEAAKLVPEVVVSRSVSTPAVVPAKLMSVPPKVVGSRSVSTPAVVTKSVVPKVEVVPEAAVVTKSVVPELVVPKVVPKVEVVVPSVPPSMSNNLIKKIIKQQDSASTSSNTSGEKIYNIFLDNLRSNKLPNLLNLEVIFPKPYFFCPDKKLIIYSCMSFGIPDIKTAVLYLLNSIASQRLIDVTLQVFRIMGDFDLDLPIRKSPSKLFAKFTTVSNIKYFYASIIMFSQAAQLLGIQDLNNIWLNFIDFIKNPAIPSKPKETSLTKLIINKLESKDFDNDIKAITICEAEFKKQTQFLYYNEDDTEIKIAKQNQYTILDNQLTTARPTYEKYPTDYIL